MTEYERNLEVHVQSLFYIELIQKQINGRGANATSIEEANRIYRNAFLKARERVFAKINTMLKPYIIYRVNKYFQDIYL